MRQYELMYILKPDLEDEQSQALVEKFKELVVKNGGEITKVDVWGKRRLAYEIDRMREGFYVVMNFKAEAAAVQELDRVVKIADEVIRHIIVREEE